jgi:hypothetical protein
VTHVTFRSTLRRHPFRSAPRLILEISHVLRIDRPITLAAALLATALALLPAVPAQAAKLRSQNLTQLITDAQMIVAGRVLSVTDGVTPTGLPYTEITLSVNDSAKGELRGGAKYKFRQFGLVAPRKLPDGTMLLSVSPEGFPRWQEGERVIAFLHKPAKKTGLQTTAGLAQGKLTVINGRVVNEFNNLGLFDGVKIRDSLLSEKEQAMLRSSGPVDAATFVGLVGRAVSQNWITSGEMR